MSTTLDKINRVFATNISERDLFYCNYLINKYNIGEDVIREAQEYSELDFYNNTLMSTINLTLGELIYKANIQWINCDHILDFIHINKLNKINVEYEQLQKYLNYDEDDEEELDEFKRIMCILKEFETDLNSINYSLYDNDPVFKKSDSRQNVIDISELTNVEFDNLITTVKNKTTLNSDNSSDNYLLMC